MFLKRLTWFAILLSAIALVLVGRLVDIQVLRAAEYEDLAARLLTRPVRYLRAPRGSILDRAGRVLVSDQPSFDVAVHYAVLSGDSDKYLRALARQLRKRGDFPSSRSIDDIVAQFRQDISHMWARLSELSGRPVSDFVECGQRVRSRAERIREGVRSRTGLDQPVAEEFELHPVVESVSDEVALAVRLEFGSLPWLRVVPGARRVAHDADAVVHLLGRMGAVSPQHLADDPLRGDKLRELQAADRCGISGVEQVAEPLLRGTRGRIVEELDGTQLERSEAQPGGNVTLTIDMDLQRYVLGVLEEAAGKSQYPAGASAVVIDAHTREVLALVSYPVYGFDSFKSEYDELRRDAKRTPLRFRAVAGQYPPGSTCKAITLVGALCEGEVSPGERIHCTGHLLPDQPNMFRCWIYNRFKTTHDAAQPEGQSAEDAIRNSCNIFFFKAGGRLGPERLCEWFSRFGLGRLQGTDLIEESPAIVPTEQRIGRRYEPADVWNFAIGQGEVTATPLQVANVGATIASGHWAPVRLWRGASDGADLSETRWEEFRRDALQTLRTGMWRVVNERGATGYYARLDRQDYVLCGKTGSAETQSTAITYRYTFEWPDGTRQSAVAYLEEDALAQLEPPAGYESETEDRPLAGQSQRGTSTQPRREKPRRVGKHAAEFYPELLPGEPCPSQAWFMGYTQPASTPHGAAPTGRVYAISVIIEFGGSGGRVAGPVAKEIAEWLLEHEQ